MYKFFLEPNQGFNPPKPPLAMPTPLIQLGTIQSIMQQFDSLLNSGGGYITEMPAMTTLDTAIYGNNSGIYYIFVIISFT